MSTPFQSLGNYPELLDVQANWPTIREEAIGAAAFMTGIEDQRARRGAWKALPLMPEEEDRAKIPEALQRQSRSFAPRTIEIVERLPRLRAYAFSLLRARSRIRPHRHNNPFVTASLCLQSGNGSYLVVDRQRREYRDGEFVIFDYRLTHEVINNGLRDRIVLLILLENGDVDG